MAGAAPSVRAFEGAPEALDVALVARVVEHDDRRAFALLVERHQGAVRALLRRLTGGDAALTDDLAQATLLRAYMTLDQYRGASRLGTWLYRIACNEFFQQRRRLRRAPEGVAPAEPSLEHEEQAAPEDSANLAIDLGRALATLEPAEREAIIVCYYAEMSHAEAAAAIGCPLGTLKSHVLRARAKLRVQLSAWAPNSLEM